jgi:hypothetical protein
MQSTLFTELTATEEANLSGGVTTITFNGGRFDGKGGKGGKGGNGGGGRRGGDGGDGGEGGAGIQFISR